MIQRPKGTKDIYGNDQKIYSLIFSLFEKLAKSYNFQKITTPIFESASLFKKTSGETSDIIIKELYSFTDLSNRELALRPEGTACIARAIVENKLLLNSKFSKLFYIGPMFRYEKPQKGRMRQFDQIGVELIGNNSIFSVVEIIVMANTFLENLKIKDFILKINNIGTKSERENFSKLLSIYFNEHKSNLSPLSVSRIYTNPIRILDDKIDGKKDVVLNAPKIVDSLSSESNIEFKNLLELITNLNIKYEVDQTLVRGLDYYTDVVFEFESNSKALGSKSTIIGGGSYENLTNDEKNKVSGVGFGVGVERLFEILKFNNSIFEEKIDIYFIINSKDEFKLLFPLICELRSHNLSIDFNKKFNNPKKIFFNALNFNPQKIIYYNKMENKGNNNKSYIIKNIKKNTKVILEINNVVKTILQGVENEKNNK